MPEKCAHCGLPIEPQPGYYLGAVYVNYGLTSLLVSVTFLLLFLGFGIAPDVLLWPMVAFCFLFPLFFFRYARSLWRSMDEFFDPYEEESEDGQRR